MVDVFDLILGNGVFVLLLLLVLVLEMFMKGRRALKGLLGDEDCVKSEAEEAGEEEERRSAIVGQKTG